MSHYVLAVFTKENQNIEDLLEPYDENITVTPYIKKTREEIIKQVKARKKKIIENIAKSNYKLSDWEREILNCVTDEDFYKSGTYEDEKYDVNGNLLSTYNPNSKWDWYEIGGRWSGMLKTKNGQHVDECLVRDLDLTPDKKEYNEAIRFWELVVEKQPLKNGEKQPFNYYKKEYFLERYGTKENYAKIQSQFSTYAVLMPDGKWYEPGQMGWWGISGATVDKEKEWDNNYHKFIDQVEADWTITIVDCHI